MSVYEACLCAFDPLLQAHGGNGGILRTTKHHPDASGTPSSWPASEQQGTRPLTARALALPSGVAEAMGLPASLRAYLLTGSSSQDSILHTLLTALDL